MGQSGNTVIVIISIVFSVVAVTAVALRFRARQVKDTPLGADDYLILPAMVGLSPCHFDCDFPLSTFWADED